MGIRVGRYETIKPIASGGMATVYLGRALGAGGFERLVGIKIMHPHIATDPEFVAMFLDEARLAARVRHPNVVATIDVQESDKGLFLVMEYIEGPSLYALIRKVHKGGVVTLPRPVALRIFLDALMGLHAAHELTDAQGKPLELIHRDVSPQNILVGADGISKITDFGVARAASRLSSTRGGQLKGKLAYMAPEQMRNEGIDRRCDVYAAGIVLWELLTGRRLFRGDSEGALVLSVLAGATESARSINPTVPEAIDAVCMRAVAKDPGGRFATANDFADAVENAAAAAGVSIATPRAIAAFVREQAAHDRPDLSGVDDAADAPLSIPSKITSVPSAVSALASAPGQEAVSSTNDVVVLTQATRPASHTRRRIIIAAGICVALAGVGVLAVKGLGGSRGAPPAAASPVPTAAEAAPPPVAPAIASDVPSATPSASASSAKRSPAPGGPASTGRKTSPPPRGTPTSFRPTDL